MLAFLHTSPTHIQRFTTLVRKYNPSIEIVHFVNEELLETVMKTGRIDLKGFEGLIKSIQEKHPKLIICTCSTYGEACNNYTNVKRIDLPIAHYIVEHFSRIILAYTAVSTQYVSKRLIEDVAKTKRKKIEIILCDCSTAWDYFLLNEMENYYKEIFRKVNEINKKGSVIFLTQASMEGAKKYFENMDVEVFSSGEFGVMKYLEEL